MVKEIISINIGQAGVQMSNAAWELFCMEHGIRSDGYNVAGIGYGSEKSQHIFFQPVNDRFVPRCMSLDLEPTVLDEVRVGVYRHLFNSNFLISGFEDSSGNFARGYFTEGKKFIRKALEAMRKLVDNCSSLQGFCYLNSYDGGTGSGFTSLLEEEMNTEYAKTSKIQLGILPSNKLASSTVSPYNAILHAHYSISHIDMCPLLDNEAIFSICTSKLKIDRPTFTNINRLIGQIFSNITVSLRFENFISSNVDQMCTNLVPYPKLHFALSHTAPICEQSVYDKSSFNTTEITSELFDLENQLIHCDSSEGKFMACSIQYRGEVSPVDVNNAINAVKRQVDVQFVDWCPTGFKVGVSCQPPASPPGSNLAHVKRNATMLSNTSSISEVWNSLIEKFNCLYSKRAFLHWFVGEGLEQQELEESKNTITEIKFDYEEISKTSQPEAIEIDQKNVANASDYFNEVSEDFIRFSESTNPFPLEF